MKAAGLFSGRLACPRRDALVTLWAQGQLTGRDDMLPSCRERAEGDEGRDRDSD